MPPTTVKKPSRNTAQGSYDLLAIDQTLPRLDGLGVLAPIASNGPLPPTVMVTGTGNEKVAVQTMKLGADDYIVKDLGGGWLDLLPSIIERVLKQRRLAEDKKGSRSGIAGTGPATVARPKT